MFLVNIHYKVMFNHSYSLIFGRRRRPDLKWYLVNILEDKTKLCNHESHK